MIAVARVEAKGIHRSHPFRIFVPAAGLLVLAAPALVLFAFDSRGEMIAQLGVSTAGLVATLLGLTAGAASLATDRRDRRDALVLSRPCGRYALVFGKWLGLSAVVFLTVAGLAGLHAASLSIHGYGATHWVPLLAAFLVAAISGCLAGALALAFSAVLEPAPALLGALLTLLAGHALSIVHPFEGYSLAHLLLPRAADLNLASEAAFGTLSGGVVLFAALHGIAYSLFALALAVGGTGARFAPRFRGTSGKKGPARESGGARPGDFDPIESSRTSP